MGWFDEQIKERMKNDDEDFSEAFANMSSVIMGKSVLASFQNDAGKISKNAIDEILKYYHIKANEIPNNLRDVDEQLEYLLRSSGIMRREVKLKEKWYEDSIGALLGKTKEGDIVALIPKGLNSYDFYDYKSCKRIKINKKNAKYISEDAICFYKPLPLKQIGIVDLVNYILQTLDLSDFIMFGVMALAVTLLGLFMPYVNKIIFENVIASGNVGLVIPATILIVGVVLSQTMIMLTKTLIMTKISTKMNIAVQSASMMRILSLPVEFFKNFSAGELSSRVQNINDLCSVLIDTIFSVGLTSVFSLIYIGQIFNYAPNLAAPALVIVFVTALFSIISAFVQIKISKTKMELKAKERGFVYAIITGIQKIKLAGAERRVFVKWANQYKKSAELEYNPPLFIKLNDVILTAIYLFGTVIIYYFAVSTKIDIANYMAFNVSYGMVSGAFISLSRVAANFAQLKPMMQMIEPILKAVPEISNDKKVINRVSGNIELNNVTFRYNENMPLVIDNLSLKIRAGQYVAIVGKTGCGKSTLIRLLLGFETPKKGAIYYDGKDISKIDLKSLRQNIGAVMQNGKLLQGDIFSNITLSAPWLTLKEAWEAAEIAGISADIKAMPMGMHTFISEGGGGISGGQRQRLMIARAIAPKPKILMFDEATSALDNITQKMISDSLNDLKCTRIVIAHRLSTIKQCDSIIVLDNGKIVEQGNYEELILKNGFFKELIERQRLDEIHSS